MQQQQQQQRASRTVPSAPAGEAANGMRCESNNARAKNIDHLSSRSR
jgi:hypothetical protein